MSSTIKGKQSWLTRQGTQLDESINHLEEFLKSAPDLPAREALVQTQQGIKELDFRQTALEKALDQYSSAADAANLTEENQAKADLNISTAQELLSRAQSLNLKLTLFAEKTKADSADTTEAASMRPQLPPLQIPKFRGLLWEWDQFWGIFSAAVHNRRISKIEKLHYLLDSLQGPAREAVQDLQITEENYDLAVNLLQSRYGNEEAIIGRLLSTLQALRPQSSSLSDQRRLFDKIVPLVSQLKQKGESVETQHMRRAILGKFTDKIQRAVLKRRESSWTTIDLLQSLHDYFVTEDEIQHAIGFSDTPAKTEPAAREQPPPTRNYQAPFRNRREGPTQNLRKFPCFYCHRTDHTPTTCTQYPTYSQRINQMQQRNLCRNCGSTAHKTPDCTRGACRQCNKKGHHTSICRQTAHKQGGTSPPQQQDTRSRASATTPAIPRPVTTQNFAALVAQPQSMKCTLGADVLSRKTHDRQTARGNIDLLIGQARVWNAQEEQFEEVHIILDTGADQSFITSDYATHLGLKATGSLPLTIRTFGSDLPMEKACETTFLQIEDRKGKRHQLKVAKVDFIAGEIHRTQLDEKDRRYLAEYDIQLSVSSKETTVTPQILLGCGDLFEFFENGLGISHNLPSGLKLLHSKIGYLVTGKNGNEMPLPSARLNTVTTELTQDLERERILWDQYWSLDSAGVEEFMGPQSQEIKDENRRIWDQFHATVERHDDGYHVRLPWKDAAQDLPDNRTIAYNRLRSVLSKLRNQPQLLSQYHNTFQEQLSKGIIEEVDEDAQPDGRVVHYLAHQAVITPHKETTRLRVVFDGSAHHKDAPCLNDKLYQGPVILPSLIDMLNRFRIGKVAIISDIEAFLQVHLQRIDRDATRCLWIRNIDQPLCKANMVTYRFTRVTFGLNCSPFLLGATIMEHLDQTTDREMAERIKDNVYVDNILMTAETPQQAVQDCIQARQLFAEINMNLREFRTNSSEANMLLPEECLGKSTTPKVLGIQWNSEQDTLEIACRFPRKTVSSKRTVSEQVATIFDPLGWMAPLMLKPKLFLQHLWKHTYTWDQALSNDHQQQWDNILHSTHDFETHLPRMVCGGTKDTSPDLVIFADASKNAMATCAYLLHKGKSTLLMAKSKLPSIKDNPTIPKLEMNALTMATRLSNTIFSALQNRVLIKEITIYSDSEIALGWIKNPKLDAKVGVLVRNRSKEVRKIVASLQKDGVTVKFGYVDTTSNPADAATRGLSKQEFNEHSLWWNGPAYLALPKQDWPPHEELSPQEQEEPSCPTILSTSNTQAVYSEVIDWSRHSSVHRATSSFAYALRWLERITKRTNPDLRDKLLKHIPELRFHYEGDFITVPEAERTSKLLLRNHQQVHVEGKINPQKDRLIPTKDPEGIIRCRGRLQQSHLPDESKFPILIGAQSDLASLIIKDAHATFHLGTAHTMTRVREKFWIPQLRRQVQKIIRRCVPCQRMNNLPYRYPEMSDLPARRVIPSRPFLHVGIDYFGPITVRSPTEETSKAYGIILTCTVTRLLHLECVPDMSTEQLLNALRRFFARRGVPETITSDNAPCVLLADQILRDAVSQVANDTTVAKVMATKGILWKTITVCAVARIILRKADKISEALDVQNSGESSGDNR